MSSAPPYPEAATHPAPPAEGVPQHDDPTRHLPQHGYAPHMMPPPPPSGYAPPPPPPPGYYTTANGGYPTVYPYQPGMPGNYVPPPPGPIVPPTTEEKESFNCCICAGGFFAGFFLGVFGYLFLFCLERKGKQKKAFVIGCTIGLLVTLIVAGAIFAIYWFALAGTGFDSEF